MSVLETAIQKVRGIRYENPIVTKELRTRMRGAKAQWLMLGYVLLLGVVVFFTYYAMWIRFAASTNPTEWMRMRIGFTMFYALTLAQTILITLIAPALSSGTITIENEQQTMEMLSMTTLSPRNIIAGKVASPMLFILMLLGISLPLAGLCLMFGSISPLEMFVTYLMLIAWAFLLTSVGVFFSSCFKKTMWAMLLAFGIAGGLTLTLGSISTGLQYSYRYGGPGSSSFIYSAIVPATGMSCALESAPVLGFKLPLALVALLTNITIGLLLLSLSLTHLKFHRVDKTLLIRSLTLVVVIGQLFLFFGNFHTIANFSDEKDMLSFCYLLLGVLMSILIPMVAVGSLSRTTSVSKELIGWPHRKLIDARPTGAMWFLALLCICGVGVTVLTALYSPFAGSTPTPQATLPHPGAPGLAGLFTTAAGNSLLGIGLPMLAWTIGFSAIAVLLASVARTRQVAGVFTFLLIVLSWVVLPSLTSWQMTTPQFVHGWKGVHGLQWNVAYLWPAIGIARLTGNWVQGVNAPWLLLSSKLVWLGATFAWLAVAFGAICLTDLKLAKRGPMPADAEE